MTVHAYYAAVKEKTMATNGNGLSKFTPGTVAEVIALARLGEEVPSSFEPFRQLRYELADGRTWYASLATGVKINNLDIGLGEPFRVCKRPFGKGSVIDVLRCNQAAPASSSPAPLSNASPSQQPNDNTGTVLAAKLEASIAKAKRPAQDRSNPAWAAREMDPRDLGCDEQRQSPPPVQQEAAAALPNSTPNGNHLSPALMTGHAQFYLERATELIDVFAAAFNYSTQAYNGTLSKEDVRALVTTVYIQQSKNGGH